jgi:hypothetical protein
VSVVLGGALDFKEGAAEEERDPGIRRIAELAIDRRTEHVTVEPPRAVQLDRTQQDATSEHVHIGDDAPSRGSRCAGPPIGIHWRRSASVPVGDDST